MNLNIFKQAGHHRLMGPVLSNWGVANVKISMIYFEKDKRELTSAS